MTISLWGAFVFGFVVLVSRDITAWLRTGVWDFESRNKDLEKLIRHMIRYQNEKDFAWYKMPPDLQVLYWKTYHKN